MDEKCDCGGKFVECRKCGDLVCSECGNDYYGKPHHLFCFAEVSDDTELFRDYLDNWIPYEYVFLDAGDGYFLAFRCTEEEISVYEKEIVEQAKKIWNEVYWCSDPDAHANDIKQAVGEEWETIVVLNLFR